MHDYSEIFTFPSRYQNNIILRDKCVYIKNASVKVFFIIILPKGRSFEKVKNTSMNIYVPITVYKT